MSSEMSCCGGLALDGLQVPIKSDPALPSSAGQGRENVMEGLCIEMRAGRDHSSVTVIGKTDLT